MRDTYAWLGMALVISLLLGLPLREAGLGTWFTGLLDGMATYTAAMAASPSRRERSIYLLAIIPAFGIGFKTAIFGSGDGLAVLGCAFLVAFLGLIATRIMLRITRLERVTADSVLGGICVYLLIGFVFYYLYTMIELIGPGSFLEGGKPLGFPIHAEKMLSRRPELNYFSFETLTTLGFGDIVPVRSIARVLTVLEALIGQVFLATFIAFLLGNYLNARAIRPRGPMPRPPED